MKVRTLIEILGINFEVFARISLAVIKPKGFVTLY